MYKMYQDPSQQRGVLRCMAYALTPHMIIQDYEFSLVINMFIDLFVYVLSTQHTLKRVYDFYFWVPLNLLHQLTSLQL
jgi:hypothetical protein